VTIEHLPTSTITSDSALGDGPIAAAFAAVDRITGMKVVLSEFKIGEVVA
jgi:hypothetical protein